jgi:hypothetical protein
LQYGALAEIRPPHLSQRPGATAPLRDLRATPIARAPTATIGISITIAVTSKPLPIPHDDAEDDAGDDDRDGQAGHDYSTTTVPVICDDS